MLPGTIGMVDARAFLSDLTLGGDDTSVSHIETLPEREPIIEPLPDLFPEPHPAPRTSQSFSGA
jgi:hypothetical protein